MDLLPQFAAVLLVFALLGATLWWLRKRGALQFKTGALPLKAGAALPFRFKAAPANKRGKILEHLDSLQLSSTHALSVVKMADRVVLLGTSPGGFYVVESSSWKQFQAQGGAAAAAEETAE